MGVFVPRVDVQDFLVPPVMEEIAGVSQCTPHDVATVETDLEGEKIKVVVTGETLLRDVRTGTSGYCSV